MLPLPRTRRPSAAPVVPARGVARGSLPRFRPEGQAVGMSRLRLMRATRWLINAAALANDRLQAGSERHAGVGSKSAQLFSYVGHRVGQIEVR